MPRPSPIDDVAGSGLPLHRKTDADPFAALHPDAVGKIEPRQMTAGRATTMGSGDHRAPVLRHGSMAHTALPSRVGSRLRWPDGSVTGLQEPQP